MTTWNSLLASITADLDKDDAQRMVEQLADYSRAELAVHGDESVSDRVLEKSEAMVTRRQKGEPLQYVLGSWGFRQLDLFVDQRVLIPRPETESVVEAGLQILQELSGEPTVVDIGTGSGAIALSIAQEEPRAKVIATDVSDEALAVARANLAGLGTSASRVKLQQGSWFEALSDELRKKVDLLISNPPYIANEEELPTEVKDWEPHSALFSGDTGIESYEILIGGAGDWLSERGACVFEIAPHQSAPLIEVAKRNSFSAAVEKDLTGRDRILVLRPA